MSPVDVAALIVMGVALLRGVWIGMVREVFSVAALAGACVSVRVFTEPLAGWILENALPGIGPLGAQLFAAAALALGTVLAVAVLGRLFRRGLHAAGLGAADRLAGGVIGTAEGALVVGIALFLAITLIGRDHPLLVASRTLETYSRVEQIARESTGTLPDVAAPPTRAPRDPDVPAPPTGAQR
jgi:membrane protein required for colicin V production